MKLLLLALLVTQLFSSDFDNLVRQIKFYEGFSSKPYSDNGHQSIGYGTNISHITQAEAHMLLVHRLAIRHERLKQLSWFNKLPPIRKRVILNMSYQLGHKGLLKFKHMIWAIKHNYWNGAANQMVSSRWYRQSGNRARILVRQMRTNKD